MSPWIAGIAERWQALPLAIQVTYFASLAVILFVGALFWTPLGNRRTLGKCLVIAVGIHLLTWFYAGATGILDRSLAELTSIREPRMRVRTTSGARRPTMNPLSDPRAHSAANIEQPVLSREEPILGPVARELAMRPLDPASPANLPEESPDLPSADVRNAESEAPALEMVMPKRPKLQETPTRTEVEEPLAPEEGSGPAVRILDDGTIVDESELPKLADSMPQPESLVPESIRQDPPTSVAELLSPAIAPVPAPRPAPQSAEPLRANSPRSPEDVDADRPVVRRQMDDPGGDGRAGIDRTEGSTATHQAAALPGDGLRESPELEPVAKAPPRLTADRPGDLSLALAPAPLDSGLPGGVDALRPLPAPSPTGLRPPGTGLTGAGRPNLGAGPPPPTRKGPSLSRGAAANNWTERVQPNRLDRVVERGGSAETERAVADALVWLAAHQEPDGNWSCSRFGAIEVHSDVGVTSLALLAFLGAGYTHTEPNTYTETIRRGLNWLLATQRANGDLRLRGRIYCHAMATLALSEALAMTGDARLLDPAQRAVDWLVEAQNPESGGWRYGPGQFGDTSVYGWAVLALHSARGAGLQVPVITWRQAQRWLRLVSSGKSGGLASYRPGDPVSHAMTAEALFCRQLFEIPRVDPALDEAGDHLLTRLPSPNDYHIYYWYYATLAMYQLGGKHWEEWNRTLVPTLLDSQVKLGPNKGSWTPERPFGIDGGRVFTTATSALCLEVYYRYLPLYDTIPTHSLDRSR